MELTTTSVEEMMKKCLSDIKIDDIPIDVRNNEDAIIDKVHLVMGISHTLYCFDIDELQKHEGEIFEALKELPHEFMQSSGEGGWSFLNSCIDRHGRQWGEHQDADMLIALGRAIGKAKWLFRREYWSRLPGGMPYLIVLDGAAQTSS